MKKKHESGGPDLISSSVFKILRVMKLMMVLICFIGLLSSFGKSYSQNAKLSVEFKNSSIESVLNYIESRTEYSFMYDNKKIDISREINISAKDQTVEAILDQLFENEVNYKVIGKHIIITPREEQPSISSVQQQKSISGIVTDSSGASLPGVSVVVKGTINGTITDADGRYSISKVPENATIQFSFVGLKMQEIIVGSKTTINVTLTEDVFGIEEVVAIGYGAVKKSDLTGSVSSVKGSVIAERNTPQISSALQGSTPGLMVTRSNNAPGESATINIRGITSINNSNPLIIVDGIPRDNINDINPNDVQDISVLKDAASASIYGSRGAAGVILVTTKRAKTGELGLDYNFEYGFEKPTEMTNYVGAARYMQVVNELRWNDNGNKVGGEYPVYSKDIIDNYTSLHAENPDLYPNTDWVNLILKDSAPRQSHIINITAGSKVIRTKISLAYDEIGGLYMGKKYQRLTSRFNNDISITKNLSASVDFYVKRSIYNNPSTDPINYMRMLPSIYAAVWSDGLIADGKSGSNPYAQLKYGGYSDTWYNQVGGKAALDFTPLNGLKFSAVISPELNYNKGKTFLKKVQYTGYNDPSVYVGNIEGASTTSLSESRHDDSHITTQFIANYTKAFGKHNLNAMIGYENYYAFYEDLGASSSNINLTSYPYLDLGNKNYLSSSGNAYENAYRSYFSRIMYNYNNKYFLQSNVRYDGSSRFDKDYRWGSFPSFSGGWVMSEEPFMKNISNLSFLKLRASWGAIGNDRIGNYPYQSTLSFGNVLFYQGDVASAFQTAGQTQYAIKNISWEKTESRDFGIDANFFDNKLRFSGSYYKKTTKDMLLKLAIPNYTGFETPYQNAGKMYTKGWEIELGWNDHFGELNYSVSANLSDFKSLMGDLGGIEFLGDQIKVKGSEYNEWYGYKSDGIYQTQEEVDNSAKLNTNVKPGDIKYVDISGPNGVPDGIVSPDYDRVPLGGSLPRYLYGGNIQLQYKNLDFSLTFQGVGKQNVRLTTSMVQPVNSNWGNVPQIIDGKYWSVYNSEEQNVAAKYPRLSETSSGSNYTMSDFWLFNGAYFRLKNITMGYNIPQLLSNKLFLQHLRIYGSVTDLFSFNKYPKGWDPEVSGTGYPITTSFILGVSVKF